MVTFAYNSLEIYAFDRTYQDTFLLARPEWNQFRLSSTDKPNKKIDIQGIECSPCFARFSAWRPDGGNSDPDEYVFNTYICADMDGSGMVDISDLLYFTDYFFNFGPPVEPEIAADINCSGVIDISDVLYLVDYIMSSGPEPVCCW